jgi:hypothetical protein
MALLRDLYFCDKSSVVFIAAFVFGVCGVLADAGKNDENANKRRSGTIRRAE